MTRFSVTNNKDESTQHNTSVNPKEFKRYTTAKANLEKYGYLKTRVTAIATLLSFSLLLWSVIEADALPNLSLGFNLELLTQIFYFAITIFSVTGFCAGLVYLCFLLYLNNQSILVRKYELNYLQQQINNDFFENSIKLSYKYLDQYYDQTKQQAQKGFFITVCIAVFGALLVGIGIVAMFAGMINPAYVTCASGVITEFIAAIFFYLYNRTVSSMSKYHNKLVLSQNISIALKVADSLSEPEQSKAKEQIVSELLKDVNGYFVRDDPTENSKTK